MRTTMWDGSAGRFGIRSRVGAEAGAEVGAEVGAEIGAEVRAEVEIDARSGRGSAAGSGMPGTTDVAARRRRWGRPLHRFATLLTVFAAGTWTAGPVHAGSRDAEGSVPVTAISVEAYDAPHTTTNDRSDDDAERAAASHAAADDAVDADADAAAQAAGADAGAVDGADESLPVIDADRAAVLHGLLEAGVTIEVACAQLAELTDADIQVLAAHERMLQPAGELDNMTINLLLGLAVLGGIIALAAASSGGGSVMTN